MPLAETLEREFGDDRNKDVEIAKLEEKLSYDGTKLYETDTPGFSPGELVLREYRLPPQTLELRRDNRYVGRKIVGLAMRQYPIQSPQPNRRAHIREVRT